MKIISFLVLWIPIASSVQAADASAASEQYNALLNEYESAGGARLFAKRFLVFAEEHAKDEIAVDALLWVVKNVRGRPDTTKALERLAEHHIDSEKLAAACAIITRSRSMAAEQLLRKAWQESPHAKTRAEACYHLAVLLAAEASVVDQLKASPDLAPRVLQYYRKDYGEYLSSLDPAELTNRREKLYEQMAKSFADVKIQNTSMGDIARRELFKIRHLSVGKVAPEIEGEDIFGNKMKLTEFRGKIVMLSFWGHW